MLTSDRPATAFIQLFQGPGEPFVGRTMALPERLAEGEILVRLTRAAICGSDLHTYEGRRREPVPSVLGHEGVGEIVGLGGGRPELREGQRVTWSLADSCGACPYCTRYRLPQKCERLFKYGHAHLDEARGPDGCYASHILLRAGTAVAVLPETVSDDRAVSANCALSTMVHAAEAVPEDAEKVWIQGAGLLGLFGAALLRARGVPRIYLSDPDDTRRARAEAVGALPVGEGEADRWFGGAGKCDAVIEVAGSPAVLPAGLEALRYGGSYLLVGLVHPDSVIPFTAEQVVRRCLRVRGIYNYAPWHLQGAVDFLARAGDAFPFADTFSRPFALGELNQAMTEARTRRWPRVTLDCRSY